MKRLLLCLTLTLTACRTTTTQTTVTTETASQVTTTTSTLATTDIPQAPGQDNTTPTQAATPLTPPTENGRLNPDLDLPVSYIGDPLIQLCNPAYLAAYSERDHLTRAVTQHLTSLNSNGPAKRTDDFREDQRLHSTRATPDDYTGTGYDRGHLAPAADFKYDPDAMSQSFLMSNIVPQNPEMNQGPWNGLEAATRACAREGSLTVITGTLGNTGPLKEDSPITIPSALFKLWYSKEKNDYRLWVLPNTTMTKLSGQQFQDYEVPLHQFREFWTDFPQTDLNELNYGTLCPSVMPLKQ
ncbi:DNA/RNA non-specific endonuclease (plasmid) [Deinococcus proteolyticus MRP]|uniref:Endonuclease n=1 Tax=Deinococcus proteolyticus (strain ATCC 35074 / DSM 20540 / JCM 6276 / NBRC 101906 / NCIMB 13154 / VKM Ac-1939 / CCM 2703 / MRP) TaxID=693977 RepID=F0RQR1_DEIPM|nr:DNA/RNA non-specific endonuclease [Deinococcus proteolyticus]ADY27620.1 DNA/RNA non-specific endonuclease [Deinococcus proteolyticus MRP]